jgi:tetratricopeptide (TPR) repeat protein
MNAVPEQSRDFSRELLGIIAIIVLPLLIALLAMAIKFDGLTDPQALDHAQVARHFANGDGLSTSVLRPLSLAVHPHAFPHPDLYNAPLHPLLLGLVYEQAGVSEKTSAVMGVVFWLVAVWLTYFLARRLGGAKTALLAMLFYGCSSGPLTLAYGGLPVPLASVLALLVLAELVPARIEEQPASPARELARLWSVGLLCGLAILTDYRMLTLAVVAAVSLRRAANVRSARWGFFLLGLGMVWGPWAWRNYQAGAPWLFGLSAFEAMAQTTNYPGLAIWRKLAIPDWPLIWLITHPAEIVRKFFMGLAHYRTALVTVDPLLIFFCGAAFFYPTPGNGLKKRLRSLLLAILAGGLVLACLFLPDVSWLAIWLPVIAIVAGAQLVDWIEERIGPVTFPCWKWLSDRLGPPDPVQSGIIVLPATLLKGLAYLVVVSWCAVQALVFFHSAPPSRDPATVKVLSQLTDQAPTNAVILTDLPAAVAWHSQRPAILLWDWEGEWGAVEKLVGPIGLTCISAQAMTRHEAEWQPWWNWVASSRGIYRGLAYTDLGEPWFCVRVPVRQPPNAPVATLLHDLEAEVAHMPQSTDAYTRLGLAYYQQNRLAEATEQFRLAILYDRYNITATFGLWRIQADLFVGGETLRLAQVIEKLPVDPSQNVAFLEEAARHFEKVWSRQTSIPWLLLNAANCYARLHRWEDVARCQAQLTKHAPRIFPPEILLANLQLQQERFAEAQATLQKLLEINPSFPVGYELLGRIHERKAELGEALRAYEKLIELAPRRSVGYQQAGRISLQLGQYAAAMTYLEKALEMAPHSIETRLAIAEAHARQDHYREAIAVYEGVLQDLPNHLTANNNLLELYARTGQLDKAMPLTTKCLKLFPSNPLIRDTVGWVCHRAGQNDAALLHLDIAVRLAPQFGLARYHLGKVLLSTGHEAAGRAALRAALEQGLPAPEQADARQLLAAAP